MFSLMRMTSEREFSDGTLAAADDDDTFGFVDCEQQQTKVASQSSLCKGSWNEPSQEGSLSSTQEETSNSVNSYDDEGTGIREEISRPPNRHGPAKCPFGHGSPDSHVLSSSFTEQMRRSVLGECPLSMSGAAIRNSFLLCPESVEQLRMQESGEWEDDDCGPIITEDDLFQHGNTAEGHFTKEFGFLIPDYDKALGALMQSRGNIWYQLGRRMAGLISRNAMIKAVDALPIVPGDQSGCPEDSLQVACGILAHLWNGYRAECWRNNVVHEPPASLQIPWTQICRRMGRKDVYFAVEDVINVNRPLSGSSYEVENLEMICPLWRSSAEDVVTKMFCAANHYFKNMLPSILALCRDEWEAKHIHTIIGELAGMIKMMGKAIPDGSAGKNSIDPVEFALAFANSTAPTKEGVPGFSGGGVPVFASMDYIIGRKSWNSQMGRDVLVQIEWMPKNWQRFIHYLRQKRIYEKVPNHLQYLWMQMKDAYAGERGWIGRHKYRAYQFTQLSGALGRSSNKGTSNGEDALEMLEEARLERDPALISDRGSYKTCMFKGKIAKITRVSEDRLTQIVTIESCNQVFLNLGDHIAIMMKNSDDRIWRFAVSHDLRINTVLSVKDGSLSQQWKERLDFDGLEYTVYNVLRCAKLSIAEKSREALDVENMCSILSPEESRLYSFATVHPRLKGKEDGFMRFNLLVTRTGHGGCSAYLFDSVGDELRFGFSAGSKFSLPKTSSRPVVVIAAGSGIGTYLPMLINDEIQNPKYAFLAFRSEDTVPYLQTKLRRAVAFDKLQLFVELSREEKSLETVDRQLISRRTKKRYLDQLMVEQGALIRELAAPLKDGGHEASFYLCGNSSFFTTVRDAMERIQPGVVESLVEANRLHLEVQARGGLDGDERPSTVRPSDLCMHNKPNDCWVSIHGTVYNFTSYLKWHPGGRKIIQYVAGTDCTEEWDLVSHGQDRMVYTQLETYEVGRFEAASGPLEEFLKHITRAENSVTLYADEHLFNNLCDSYGKVMMMVQNVFSEEFFMICMDLEKETRVKVLHRIWYAFHGQGRLIADQIYKIAPLKGSKNHFGYSYGTGDKLRVSGSEEVELLKQRIMKATDRFFFMCKNAVAEYLSTGSASQCPVTSSKMFFRLALSIEQLISSLSQPIHLQTVRKWDILKAEIIARKTFMLRFGSPGKMDESFATLTLESPSERNRIAHVEALMEHFAHGEAASSRADCGEETSLVNDFFEHQEEWALFLRLDANGDGLLSVDEVVSASRNDGLTEKDRNFIAEFMASDLFKSRETFTFFEFLEGDPEVAKLRKLRRVSSLLFK